MAVFYSGAGQESFISYAVKELVYYAVRELLETLMDHAL